MGGTTGDTTTHSSTEPLLIAGAKILVDSRAVLRDILIQNGRIQAVLNPSKKNDFSASVIDAKGLIALPGLIDTHVHFREPGHKHKEDWKTGSSAAAAGGITTVFDMPNTNPPTFTRYDLEHKRKLASEQSLVNFGLYLGASLAYQQELADPEVMEGVPGVKFYFDKTTGNNTIALYGSGRELVRTMLRNTAKNGRLAVMHAEGMSARDGLALAREAACPAMIAHTPGVEELDHIARARKHATAPVYCEVTPHHLFMTKSALKEYGPFARMNPPLKTKRDMEELWTWIRKGLVDTIGSDHAPHTSNEKLMGESVPAGVPGLETTLALLLNAHHRKMLTLPRIQQLCAENPARIFGIQNKGQLKPGFDADIVLIDLKEERKVENGTLFTKCGWSPFNGKKLKGWPVQTFVHGTLVYDRGEIVAKPGVGQEASYAH